MALLLAACSDGGRNATDGRQVFRAIIADPIPAGVSAIESAGIFGEEGHVIYLSFTTTEVYLATLIETRNFVPFDCDTDFIVGNLTLSQSLLGDLPDWYPFNDDPANTCYTTGRSYTNAWTRGARGILLYQPRTGRVYYNEVGV